MFEGTAEAVQQRSLDSLAKVLDNRRALDYLLVEQEESVLWPPPPAAPGSALLGRLKLSYTGHCASHLAQGNSLP